MTLTRTGLLISACTACWVALRMLGLSIHLTAALLLPGFGVLVWCWSDKR